jgi:PAS domain S-box-containing protein
VREQQGLDRIAQGHFMRESNSLHQPAAYECFAGNGAMAARMRNFGWSKTPLGPVERWPQSLRTTVRMMLTSRYAMWMAWGPDLIVFYNDAYSPTLGIKQAWALGAPASTLWAEIWPDIGPRIESVLKTGEATWDEGLLLFLERSGYPEETYHTFSYSPLADDSGNVSGMLCVVTEETDRVIGERRLKTLRDLGARTPLAKTAEEACRLLVTTLGENTADVPFSLLYLTAHDGTTARLCEASQIASGTTASPEIIELMEPSFTSSWPLAESAAQDRPVLVADASTRFGELPVRLKNVTPKEAIVLPLRTASQERPAAFLIAGISPFRAFDDSYRGFFELVAGQAAAAISNANAYAEERRRAEALAELDRAKTAFFSNVSHEFRTPLTLMLGPAREALAEAASPEQTERLEMLYRNAIRLQKLVNTLLDFSRIEAGRVQASYESTDLATFTAELASVFRSAIEKARMRLLVDCQPLREPVYVDRDMWEKVVLNLLSNAFKFTLEGEIAVSLSAAANGARLVVRDTGTGIAAEQLPHIFERFHRVEGTRARTHEGTGIGLALVQELVRLHGGTVEVTSVLDQGTTFTVTIPFGRSHLPADRIGGGRAPASTAVGARAYVVESLRWLPESRNDDAPLIEALERSPSPGQQAVAATRPRIVLADDNADMREYVRRLLASHYEVEAVADGEAALASARAGRPDLVLTDVMMPRLDGFGLLRELRSDPRTASIPVIMLSARSGEEARVDGIQSGADDYLVKPFSARELQARVSAHIELARARREAAAADERAAVILESITDAFFALDASWRFTYVNAEAEHINGVSHGALIGQNHWDVFPATVGTIVDVEFHRALAEQVSVEFENYYEPHKQWYAIRAYPARGGGLSVYFRNITERKAAERAALVRADQLQKLADLASRLHSARDVASLLAVITAEARALIGASRAVSSLTDAAGGSVVRNTISTPGSTHIDVQSEFVSQGSAVHAALSGTYRPLRLTRAELARKPELNSSIKDSLGRERERGWLGASLRGSNGRSIGVIQLSDKIEGEFTAEDEAVLMQLSQMTAGAIESGRLYQELRDNDKRKDEFLAMLAHELRNPLAAVGNAVTVLKLSDDTENLNFAKEIIERQVRQLVRLIDDLLDVSRITSGKIRLKKEFLDAANILDQAIESVSPLIEERKHELVRSYPHDLICIRADPTRIEQIVVNLLTNAAKYTESGGKIWLTAALEGAHVVIKVRDTGIGIPPEKLPDMFKLFSQGERSIARSEGGLGIGLTIVQKLAEMHDGIVTASSEGTGRGSEFVVFLPAAKRPQATATSSESGRSESRRGSRILVVDDNVDTAKGMARLLKLLGNDVREVHDGKAAIEMVRIFQPEFILLDIGLPGMDGYQVAATLRKDGSCKDTVIIAVSGYGQEEHRRRSRDAGFDHHLVKPVDFDTLTTLLSRM